MRQLITRIDDALHDRLRARAASEGRSVNALVTEVLTSAVTKKDEREVLRARLQAAGLLVTPPRPKRRPPSLDKVIASTRGSGTSVSEALEADRDHR